MGYLGHIRLIVMVSPMMDVTQGHGRVLGVQVNVIPRPGGSIVSFANYWLFARVRSSTYRPPALQLSWFSKIFGLKVVATVELVIISIGLVELMEG